jgi:hypothetical protein
MSKRKAQGTRHESWLVTQLKSSGHRAKRLAEGGTKDEGDVETWIAGERWVMEAKARQNLNVQETLGATRRKAQAANDGIPVPVAVVWKRLVPTEGYRNRQPVAGERVVITMGLSDFLLLLARLAPAADTLEDTPDAAA